MLMKAIGEGKYSESNVNRVIFNEEDTSVTRCRCNGFPVVVHILLTNLLRDFGRYAVDE